MIAENCKNTQTANKREIITDVNLCKGLLRVSF